MNKKSYMAVAFLMMAVAIAGAVSPVSMLLGSTSAGPSRIPAEAPGKGIAEAVFNCNTLFQEGAAYAGGTPLVSQWLTNGSNFNYLLGIGLLIILLILALDGILYAIGRAFGINKLVDYVRREYVEVLANIIIIIVVLVGGFYIFNNASIFFGNLAAAGAGSSLVLPPPPSGAAGSNASPGLFINVCNNYENSIINNNLYNYISVVLYLFFVESTTSTIVNADPNAFGFAIKPFTGVQTLLTTLWSEEAISFAIISMGALVVILLFVIYFLFPIFFYVGIVLRCFPWTRAAGGSMLALFISFYIFLPALLYAFSQVSVNSITLCGGTGTFPSTQSLCNSGQAIGNLGSSIYSDAKGYLDAVFSIIGETSFGVTMFENVIDFTNVVAYAVLQMIGLIISFIIAYDLLEFLGDILGAPSLQSNRILGKVL